MTDFMRQLPTSYADDLATDPDSGYSAGLEDGVSKHKIPHGTKESQDADDDPSAPVIDVDRARSVFTEALKLLDQLQDGQAPPKLRERRQGDTQPQIRHARDTRAQEEEFPLPADIDRALSRIPEPRRQRVQRNIQERKVYTLAQIRTPAMMKEIQAVTPAGASIVVHLAQHSRRTVSEIAAALDIRRKTVQNLLSILVAKKLVLAEDR